MSRKRHLTEKELHEIAANLLCDSDDSNVFHKPFDASEDSYETSDESYSESDDEIEDLEGANED